jgi:hypothetical protein
MGWHRDGTLSATAGSATLVGTNTNWGDHHKGWILVIEGDTELREIIDVVSSTEILLASAFGGTTGSALNYVIIPTHALTADLVARINLLTAEVSAARLQWSQAFNDFNNSAFNLWLNMPGNAGMGVTDFIEAITGPRGLQGDQGPAGPVRP